MKKRNKKRIINLSALIFCICFTTIQNLYSLDHIDTPAKYDPQEQTDTSNPSYLIDLEKNVLEPELENMDMLIPLPQTEKQIEDRKKTEEEEKEDASEDEKEEEAPPPANPWHPYHNIEEYEFFKELPGTKNFAGAWLLLILPVGIGLTTAFVHLVTSFSAQEKIQNNVQEQEERLKKIYNDIHLEYMRTRDQQRARKLEKVLTKILALSKFNAKKSLSLHKSNSHKIGLIEGIKSALLKEASENPDLLRPEVLKQIRNLGFPNFPNFLGSMPYGFNRGIYEEAKNYATQGFEINENELEEIKNISSPPVSSTYRGKRIGEYQSAIKALKQLHRLKEKAGQYSEQLIQERLKARKLGVDVDNDLIEKIMIEHKMNADHVAKFVRLQKTMENFGINLASNEKIVSKLAADITTKTVEEILNDLQNNFQKTIPNAMSPSNFLNLSEHELKIIAESIDTQKNTRRDETLFGILARGKEDDNHLKIATDGDDNFRASNLSKTGENIGMYPAHPEKAAETQLTNQQPEPNTVIPEYARKSGMLYSPRAGILEIPSLQRHETSTNSSKMTQTFSTPQTNQSNAISSQKREEHPEKISGLQLTNQQPESSTVMPEYTRESEILHTPRAGILEIPSLQRHKVSIDNDKITQTFTTLQTNQPTHADNPGMLPKKPNQHEQTTPGTPRQVVKMRRRKSI